MSDILRGLRDAALAMSDLYLDPSPRPTQFVEIRSAAAHLFIALLLVRNDRATHITVCNGLALLHGRWVSYHMLLQCSNELQMKAKNRLGVVMALSDMVNIVDGAEYVNELQIIPEVDDLVKYSQVLGPWYGQVLFPDKFSWNSAVIENPPVLQNSDITIHILERALRAVDLVGFFGGLRQPVPIGESHPSTSADREDPAVPIIDDLSVQCMYTTGHMSETRIRPYPFGAPVRATSQALPFHASMIVDLLRALPCNEADRFNNQSEVLERIVTLEGLTIQVSFTSASFCCEPCQEGFDDLREFIEHLHRSHFLSLSQKCRCQICEVVFGDFVPMATNVLKYLKPQWEIELRVRQQNGISGLSIPSLPIVDNSGRYQPNKNTDSKAYWNEARQGYALSGLWGTDESIYWPMEASNAQIISTAPNCSAYRVDLPGESFPNVNGPAIKESGTIDVRQWVEEDVVMTGADNDFHDGWFDGWGDTEMFDAVYDEESEPSLLFAHKEDLQMSPPNVYGKDFARSLPRLQEDISDDSNPPLFPHPTDGDSSPSVPDPASEVIPPIIPSAFQVPAIEVSDYDVEHAHDGTSAQPVLISDDDDDEDGILDDDDEDEDDGDLEMRDSDGEYVD
ncbi:Hypothetical protein D9617_14g077460 [Elsinoe fawcettii]|nr:Hypothetical protein D9617_14g077460 [Elsinoe fawcettii]